MASLPPSKEHDHFRPQSHRARSTSRRGRDQNFALAHPPKFCLIHGQCSHSSEECFAIQKLQQQHTITASAPRSDFRMGNVQLPPG